MKAHLKYPLSKYRVLPSPS